MANSFNSNIEALLGKLENFVTTKTVVGEAIHLDGIILLPLVEVTFGAAAGAKDSGKVNENHEAGAGGVGGRIIPSAVIVISDGNVQLVNVKNQDSLNKLIDLFPGILSKFNVGKKSEGKDDSKPEDISWV
ncbi:MAG: GerW family sporulation protein [Defluviitaleaceae bacterium]|nr:GerW family sporulation protein [Defluviitaleaceae bacterium]